MLNIDRLTLGEVATIESLSEASIDQIGEGATPKGKMLAAMYMIAKRRDGEPKFTFNQAMAIPIDEATKYLGFDAEEDTDVADGGTGEADPAPKAKTPAKKK